MAVSTTTFSNTAQSGSCENQILSYQYINESCVKFIVKIFIIIAVFRMLAIMIYQNPAVTWISKKSNLKDFIRRQYLLNKWLYLARSHSSALASIKLWNLEIFMLVSSVEQNWLKTQLTSHNIGLSGCWPPIRPSLPNNPQTSNLTK